MGRMLRISVAVCFTLALAACARAPLANPGASSPAGSPTGASTASAPASATQSPTAPTASTTSSVRPTATGTSTTCNYRVTGGAAKRVDPPQNEDVPATGSVTFTLKLTVGSVVITMDRAKAPCAVNSFESLASQGFFDNTPCHRLADRGFFLLQCGDPTGKGQGGPGYVFDDEVRSTDTYQAGTVAMATTQANSNGSQFFMVYSDSPLPAKYTILGHMDEASRQVIAGVAQQGEDGAYKDGSGHPIQPVDITSVVAG